MVTNNTPIVEKNGRDSPPVLLSGAAPAFRTSLSPAQKDVLEEAREMLQEPSRNTKRRILLSINLIIGVVFSIHVVIQLATAGHLPDPGRDNVLLPATIFVNLGSAA